MELGQVWDGGEGLCSLGRDAAVFQGESSYSRVAGQRCDGGVCDASTAEADFIEVWEGAQLFAEENPFRFGDRIVEDGDAAQLRKAGQGGSEVAAKSFAFVNVNFADGDAEERLEPDIKDFPAIALLGGSLRIGRFRIMPEKVFPGFIIDGAGEQGWFERLVGRAEGNLPVALEGILHGGDVEGRFDFKNQEEGEGGGEKEREPNLAGQMGCSHGANTARPGTGSCRVGEAPESEGEEGEGDREVQDDGEDKSARCCGAMKTTEARGEIAHEVAAAKLGEGGAEKRQAERGDGCEMGEMGLRGLDAVGPKDNRERENPAAECDRDIAGWFLFKVCSHETSEGGDVARRMERWVRRHQMALQSAMSGQTSKMGESITFPS